MWWRAPALRGFDALLPACLLELVAQSYVLIATELPAPGPDAGRLFEQAFYRLGARSGMQLCETAGSRSLFKFRTASGYAHELDCSLAGVAGLSAWELKHVGGFVPKNELLIFNSKTFDYYQSFDRFHSAIPLYRLLLTTGHVEPECRRYGACGGIILVDPFRLPMPLLHEAIRHGLTDLSRPDAHDALQALRWACRPLQNVVCDLCRQAGQGLRHPGSRSTAVVELQVKLSRIVAERLQQEFPDWEDELLQQSWRATGGWACRVP